MQYRNKQILFLTYKKNIWETSQMCLMKTIRQNHYKFPFMNYQNQWVFPQKMRLLLFIFH